ncbi:drug/metabolite exporter YedA [Nibricoccus sp. IMCC34717]|uniref:drug/metabolite exporter YedA n=1 Tax=Nibricoccus sp. IMCC34717 TaxID=3034021 RepID=UPI00384C0067
MNAAATSPSRAALVAALATIYLVWGSTYLAIRVAVEQLPPFAMAGARFLLAGAVLYGFLRLRRMPAPTRGQWRDNGIIGVFLLLGGNGLVCYAEVSVPSGIAALVVSAGPVFVVLLEWLWPGGGAPRPLTWLGLAFGIAGVTWLAAPWETGAQVVSWGGLAALLGACASWSVGAIFIRRSRHQPPAMMAAAIQMLCGGLALAAVGAVRGELPALSPVHFTGPALLAFAYLIIVGSLVGFSTFAWLMKNTTPAVATTYAYVNPVVAVLLGWLILDEPLSPHLGIAAVFIVTGVVLISWARTHAPRPVPVVVDTPQRLRN